MSENIEGDEISASNKENLMPKVDDNNNYEIVKDKNILLNLDTNALVTATSPASTVELFKPLNNNSKPPAAGAKKPRKRKLLTKITSTDQLSILEDDLENVDEATSLHQQKRSKYSFRNYNKTLNEKQKLINDIKQLVANFEQYIKNSKNILKLHCEFLRNEINVQSETICKRIELFHNNLVKSLNQYEKNCTKNINKKIEVRKFSDVIADAKSKLNELDMITSFDDDEIIDEIIDDQSVLELKDLHEKLIETRTAFKNYIFGQKLVKFEKSAFNKEENFDDVDDAEGKDYCWNFNLIGCFKEKYYFNNCGLNIRRLIENINEDQSDSVMVKVENVASDLAVDDIDGITVADTITIHTNEFHNKKPLKWINIIENLKFKSTQRKQHEQTDACDYQQFITKIDFDKIILCKKMNKLFQLDLKIIDVRAQQVKHVIQNEHQLQKFDLIDLITNNQYIFLVGYNHKLQPEHPKIVVEKYDQQFNLYNRLVISNFNKKPLAVACTQNLMFILGENLKRVNEMSRFFIEVYDCDELKKIELRCDLSDFNDLCVDEVGVYLNDEYLVIIWNRKHVCCYLINIERADVSGNAACTSSAAAAAAVTTTTNDSIKYVELQFIKNYTINFELNENYKVDSLLNLLFFDKNLNLNYFSLFENCLKDQFKIENYEFNEHFTVTNDGYFVLLKKNFNLEVY